MSRAADQKPGSVVQPHQVLFRLLTAANASQVLTTSDTDLAQ